MSKKKKSKVSSFRVGLYAAAGILVFLLLSTLYDFLVGDVNVRRIFTFQLAVTGLVAIGSIIGFRKLYQLFDEQI